MKGSHLSERHRLEAIEQALLDIWWMAKRYAKGRMNGADQLYNEAIKKAIEAGVQFPEDHYDGQVLIAESAARQSLRDLLH